MIAAAAAWGWLLSWNVPRGDDLVYLEWAMAHRGEPLAGFVAHPPFPGWRPVNGTAWWVAAALDGWQGRAPAVTVAVAWWVALVTWMAFAARRGGPRAALLAGCLLLASPWFRDLPTWRSWLTTTGELALLGLALLALELRRPWLAAAAGIGAILFKEPAVLVLVPAAGLVYRRWPVALVVGVAALPSIAKFAAYSASDAGTSPAPLTRAVAYLGDLGGSVWVPGLAAATVHPALAALGLLGLWAPLVAGLGALGISVRAAVRTRSPWAVAVAAPLALPLLYGHHNPVYLLESVVLATALGAAALAGTRAFWPLLAVAGLTALTTLPASLENRRWQQEQLALAHHIQDWLGQAPPGRVHVTEDVHDGGRFAAWWLVHARGWQQVDERQAVEAAHGVTVSGD